MGMKKAILFRVVLVLVAMIAFGWLPQPVLAQRGGHGGGGGGFHGGGGGFHAGGGGGFHGGGGFYAGSGHSGYGGGHYYGGYRGGYYGGRDYYGSRGGYGWGGRGWGYGRGGTYWGPDTVTDGAGDGELASVGRTGVGDIRRMATTTTRGITHPTHIILTLTIPIRILTTGSTILHRQIPTHGPSPTGRFPSNPGDPSHREKT